MNIKKEIFVLIAVLANISATNELTFKEKDLNKMLYGEILWQDLKSILIKLSSQNLIQFISDVDNGFAEAFRIYYDRKDIENHLIKTLKEYIMEFENGLQLKRSQ